MLIKTTYPKGTYSYKILYLQEGIMSKGMTIEEWNWLVT